MSFPTAAQGIISLTFLKVYEERYERKYGFWRPYVRKVIYRYLDCGDLHNAFARVKCKDCNHEHLPAFSCKRRHFCPSCQQKRVVEFGEWLCTYVWKKIPHGHFVFSIPKILRRSFLYDRKLLADLSRCAWESMKVFLQEEVPDLLFIRLADRLMSGVIIMRSLECFRQSGVIGKRNILDEPAVLPGYGPHLGAFYSSTQLCAGDFPIGLAHAYAMNYLTVMVHLEPPVAHDSSSRQEFGRKYPEV